MIPVAQGIAQQRDIEEGVGTPSLDIQSRRPFWPLIDALLGGTRAMRAGKEDWLPRWELESPKKYAGRLSRSFLAPLFERHLVGLSHMPFQDQATIDGELPDGLELMVGDVDGSGTALEDHGQATHHEALAYGLAGLYVEGPAIGGLATNRGEEMDLAAENPRAAQPRVRLIAHNDILEVRKDKATGDISRLRLLERTVEPSGEYGDETVVRAIDITPTEITRWIFTEGQGWERDGEPARNELGIVPFVCLDIARRSRPPLDALADINLHHFQVDSDYGNNLSFGAIGLLVISGTMRTDDNNRIKFESGGYLHVEEPNGGVTYAEQEGKALEAHRQRGVDLENAAMVEGAAPLTETTSTRTATEVDSSDKRALTRAEYWARQVGRAYTAAFKMAAKWVRVDLPEDFAISFTTDFSAERSKWVALQTLGAAAATGAIPQVEFVRQLKRYNVLDSKLSAEELVEQARNEGSPAPFEADDEDPVEAA